MAKTILVVDDSISLRTVVKIALERAGYAVLEAGDGVQALAALDKAGKVNLIVSDVNMPNMNGIELLSKVKQHARHKFVPVIMLTTESQSEKKEQGRAGRRQGLDRQALRSAPAAGRGVEADHGLGAPDEPPTRAARRDDDLRRRRTARALARLAGR
jgi:two-component system chemotaxis response regulator CheY